MKYFVAGCLALMATLMWLSAEAESQTYDEAVHLFSGYAYWTEGDFRWNIEHPPLSKLLQATPLLAIRPPMPIKAEHRRAADTAGAARDFVHHNTVPNLRLLRWGRAGTMLTALLLGTALFWWTRLQGGGLAGAIAVALYVLDSNFLAHGHYITSDVPVSLAIFLAAVTWLRYLQSGTRRDFVWATVALGAAMATKYSALYLLPVHLIVALAVRFRLTSVRRFVVVAMAGAAVCASTYGSASVQAFLQNPRKPLATLRDNHPYVKGVRDVVLHNEIKQFAYLNGEVYRGGKWQYFPVAFAVKTPAAALLGMGLAFWVLRKRLRGLMPFLLYPAVYFALAMASDINLGIRHLLPVYPFLYVVAGLGMAQFPWRRDWILGALAALAAFEAARIHPSHIAFFNLLSGGPDKGENYLVDSNLDWGQDLHGLSEFIAKNRGTAPFDIAYFGFPDPSDYGITGTGGVPGAWMKQEITGLHGWIAISVTLLHDDYFDKPTYSWLRAKKPVARIGRSIYVYDFRRESGGR